MADILTQGEKNLELLRKSIPKNERLWLWCIDPDGLIISTDCPKPEAFISAFKAMDGLKRALERALDCNPRPLLIGTAVGMQWAAAFEPNEKGLTRHIYLLGPVFYRDLSIREVREGLELYANAGADLKWRSELINVIGSIPVLSFAIFSRYAILLHNLLNSEQLSVTDLSGRDLPEGFIQAKKSEKPHDRHRVWQAETALLQMVKNGDKTEKKSTVRMVFINTAGMNAFNLEVNNFKEYEKLSKYFDTLFGVQKTLGNAANTWKQQMTAIKDVASGLSAAMRGEEDAGEKAAAAINSLDAAVYGDRTEWIRRADAALAAFNG